MKQIPIKNIYYLLSYAWDKLDETELTSAGIDDFDEVANLLGKVLANGCRYLFKRGLYRNYQSIENESPGIRNIPDQFKIHQKALNKEYRLDGEKQVEEIPVEGHEYSLPSDVHGSGYIFFRTM